MSATRDQLIATIESFIDKYRDNEALYNEDPQEYRRRRLRIESQLNGSFRDLVSEVLETRLSADHDPDANPEFRLAFTPEDHEVLSARFRNVERSDDAVLDPTSTEAGLTRGYAVLTFPELLEGLYRSACRVAQLRLLERRLHESESEHTLLGRRLQRLREDRGKLAGLLVAPGAHEQFHALCRRHDREREELARKELVRQLKGLHSKNEIFDLIQQGERRSQLRRDLDALLIADETPAACKARDLYHQLERTIALLAERVILVEHRRGEAHARLEAHRQWMRTLPQDELLREVREELAFAFEAADYGAQIALAQKVYVFSRTREVVTAERLQRVFARVEEFHPEVFDNLRSKRLGRPEIAIIPGCGMGVNDYVNNRLLIPWTYPRTLLESVASAVIMYIKDVQSHSYEAGDKLLETYAAEIKRDQRLRSFKKIHRALLKDYVKWVEKGTEGHGVFDKDTRVWFENYIAPNKHNVKAPLELKSLSGPDQRKQISELIKLADPDLEDCYVLALLWALQEKWEQANEAFIDLVERDVDNRYPDAIYNLGIIARKTQRYGDARRHFERFIAKAAPSWWTRKAQEHLRAVSER